MCNLCHYDDISEQTSNIMHGGRILQSPGFATARPSTHGGRQTWEEMNVQRHRCGGINLPRIGRAVHETRAVGRATERSGATVSIMVYVRPAAGIAPRLTSR